MTQGLGILTVAASLALAGCIGGGSRSATMPGQPQPQMQQSQFGKPSVLINASVSRVQDVIIDRALQRNTTVVGANLTGVTLERPLPSSSEFLVQSCGPHQPNRSVRIYLATTAQGANQTLVEEDRFVIDGGSRVCALNLPAADVEEANQALLGLKTEAERRPSPVAANPNAAVRPLAPVPVR